MFDDTKFFLEDCDAFDSPAAAAPAASPSGEARARRPRPCRRSSPPTDEDGRVRGGRGALARRQRARAVTSGPGRAAARRLSRRT